MGLMPASYKVTARSVSRVLGDGRRQSDRSLKGHEAGVRKGQPWAVNHHPGIVAVHEPALGHVSQVEAAVTADGSHMPGPVEVRAYGHERSGRAAGQRWVSSRSNWPTTNRRVGGRHRVNKCARQGFAGRHFATCWPTLAPGR